MKAVRMPLAGAIVAAGLLAAPEVAGAAVTGPDLSISMTGTPSPVALYGTVTYTILVRNNEPAGGVSATNVVVNDVLGDDPSLMVGGFVPVLGSYIQGISSTYSGSTCSVTPDPGQLPQPDPLLRNWYQLQKQASCNLGTLPPSTTATITVTVVANRTNTLGQYAPNPIVNTARVSSDTQDPTPADDAAQVITPIQF